MLYMRVFVWVCVLSCMRVCMRVCVYVPIRVYVCVCKFAGLGVCMCVHACVRVCMCIYGTSLCLIGRDIAYFTQFYHNTYCKFCRPAYLVIGLNLHTYVCIRVRVSTG